MAIIALDIETVPRAGIMDTWYPEWAAQKYPGKEGEDLEAMAALYPEFGQVCCISWTDAEIPDDTIYHTLARTLDEEREMLRQLGDTLERDAVLVGHNLKGFDIPFLAKRCMAHGLKVPAALNQLGKKPWEVRHLDTMELMKFGSGNMSLRSACLMLGLDDPKQDACGAKVLDLFKAGRMESIGNYCSGDVRAVRDIFQALRTATGAV